MVPCHPEMQQITIRAPAYLAPFRCIGSACEDHCCGGWQNVDVDGESLERLVQVAEPELGPKLRRLLVCNPEPSGPEELGLIPVTTGGACPFLTRDQLCEIQEHLGEMMIPTTCDTFPRQAMLVDNLVDLGARFACPEVVRLALLERQALMLSEVEPDRRFRERGQYWVERPWTETPDQDPRRHYHLVRSLVRRLLERADHSIEARLEALGLALASLGHGTTPTTDTVDHAFQEADVRLPSLETELTAGRFPTGPADLSLRRLRVWVAMANLPSRYRECLDRVRDGLALPAGPDEPVGEQTRQRYAAALEQHYLPYLERRPWLLQNLLLNEVHTSNFPFHPTRSMFEEYAVLASRYAIVKLHLVGVAAAERGLSDELVVETVQAFEKYADSAEYWERTLRLLKRDRGLTIDALTCMIRA